MFFLNTKFFARGVAPYAKIGLLPTDNQLITLGVTPSKKYPYFSRGLHPLLSSDYQRVTRQKQQRV